MKNNNLLKRSFIIIFVWIASLITIMSFSVKAQEVIQNSQVSSVVTNHDQLPCITKEMHDEMKSRTTANMSRLRSEGNLMPTPDKTTVVTQTFAWPLTYNSNFYDNEYYYIQNYVDHDATIGSVEEYNCGDRTYDKPNNGGYNHSGTDICIGPYYWSMMDSMFVNVIAAAPGQIVDKDDGNYDRNCGFGAGSPNYVKIMHADGSYAVYYHMKSGSVTSKFIGETVEEGEYLGLVGSSGSSTNPHLHFEVLDQNSNPIDPWVGPCNPDISTSLWKNQLPYYNPGILRLITMSGSVPSTNCPDPEQLTIKNHFNPGDYIRFEIQLRDIMQGLPIGITVYDNLGNQILTNIHNYSGTFLVQGYYSDAMILPTTTGTYKMAVSYGGKSAVHYFTVGCPGAYNLTTVHSGKKGYLTGSSITSASQINSSSSNNIWYEAETYIQANPGFRATAGCTFTARINNCTIGGAKESSDLSDNPSTSSTLMAIPSVANAETKLQFNLSTDDEINLSVFDLTGRKIQTLINGQSNKQGKHEVTYNTASLVNGLYLVKLSGKQTDLTCKLVIQH